MKDFYPLGFSAITERRLGFVGGGACSPLLELFSDDKWTFQPLTKDNPRPRLDRRKKIAYLPLNADSLSAFRMRTVEMAKLAFTPSTLPKDISEVIIRSVEDFRLLNIIERIAGISLAASPDTSDNDPAMDKKRMLESVIPLIQQTAEFQPSLRFLLTLSLYELEAGKLLYEASNPTIKKLVDFCRTYLWAGGEESVLDFNTSRSLAGILQALLPLLDNPPPDLNFTEILSELLKALLGLSESNDQKADEERSVVDELAEGEGEIDGLVESTSLSDKGSGKAPKGLPPRSTKYYKGKWQTDATAPMWSSNFSSYFPTTSRWGQYFKSYQPAGGYKDFFESRVKSDDLKAYYMAQSTGRTIAQTVKDVKVPAKSDLTMDELLAARPQEYLLHWGRMRVISPDMPLQSSKKVIAERLERKRATDMGAVPRLIHRLPVDQKIFSTTRRNPSPCSILMDCSGSMAISTAILVQLLDKAPRATIARYNGGGNTGKLIVLARDGRRVAAKDVGHGGAGNVIDGPALRWLARQPGPRYWISDGGVTGINDNSSYPNVFDCFIECMVSHIYQVYNVDMFLSVVDKKIPLPPLNVNGVTTGNFKDYLAKYK